MAAVDALKVGDVLVVSESACSFWGELLSTAAQYRGCRGVVLDGPTRDSMAIRAMSFPVFHVGFHPADSLGRLDVVSHNVPISCADVLVAQATWSWRITTAWWWCRTSRRRKRCAWPRRR